MSWPRLPDPEKADTCADAILVLVESRLQEAERAHLEADAELARFRSRVPVMIRHGVEDPTWTGNGWVRIEADLAQSLEAAATRAEMWRITLQYARNRLTSIGPSETPRKRRGKAAIPVKSEEIVQISGKIISDTGENLTVKRGFATITAGSTSAAVITGVTGKKIRVLSMDARCGGTATTIVFESKGSGTATAKTPVFDNAIRGNVTLGYNPDGWFESISGEGVTATTGSGSSTTLIYTYVEHP